MSIAFLLFSLVIFGSFLLSHQSLRWCGSGLFFSSPPDLMDFILVMILRSGVTFIILDAIKNTENPFFLGFVVLILLMSWAPMTIAAIRTATFIRPTMWWPLLSVWPFLYIIAKTKGNVWDLSKYLRTRINWKNILVLNLLILVLVPFFVVVIVLSPVLFPVITAFFLNDIYHIFQDKRLLKHTRLQLRKEALLPTNLFLQQLGKLHRVSSCVKFVELVRLSGRLEKDYRIKIWLKALALAAERSVHKESYKLEDSKENLVKRNRLALLALISITKTSTNERINPAIHDLYMNFDLSNKDEQAAIIEIANVWLAYHKKGKHQSLRRFRSEFIDELYKLLAEMDAGEKIKQSEPDF